MNPDAKSALFPFTRHSIFNTHGWPSYVNLSPIKFYMSVFKIQPKSMFQMAKTFQNSMTLIPLMKISSNLFRIKSQKIEVDLVQIQLMTLVSSTLQIRRHEYFAHFNIVKYVGLSKLPFYAIHMDVVNLFANSFSLFLIISNLYRIYILYQFE
jgi:hypothetical protein